MQAYIMINTRPSMPFWRVPEALLKIEGVKTTHAVTGDYDVIAFIEFDTMETLGKIMNNCYAIEGVSRTRTAIVVPEHIVD